MPHHDLQGFARRLKEMRVAKGWKQSDLARAVWGEKQNKDGRMVAKNRDRISQYEQARGYPTAPNLKKIADALGCEPLDLDPDIASTWNALQPLRIGDGSRTVLNITTDPLNPSMADITVNAYLPTSVALKIGTLVHEAEETKRGADGDAAGPIEPGTNPAALQSNQPNLIKEIRK
jgi:transcriptional regulator with XRE-family HTH domain